MQELMQRHLDAFANADWDAYKADFAPDVVYEELATGKRVSGHDAYVEAVKMWKTGFPDAKGTIKRFFTSGDTAIAELEWQGTNTGTLETPFGTMPATNRKVTVQAVLIHKLENGKIVETRHFFDLMTIMRQLGLAAPQPTARPEAQRAPLH